MSPPPNSVALEAESAFLRGIKAWRDHPWRRDLPDPPEVWREGTARLLDYGGTGPIVLFVPSLVNRWTVLDLMPDHSMLRFLAERGVHPLLLDWGEAEPAFTLTDYIAGRLARAMVAVGEKSILAGYCMGGTFAVAAAALRPDLTSGLALLATPWDFHAGEIGRLHKLGAARAFLEQAAHGGGTVPVELLQTLFALADPGAVAEKFRRFARYDPSGPEARLFVAIEDWLNDGVPLSAAVAAECARDWYGENLPARGAWRVSGLPIDPARITVPALVAVPRRDRIVPPDSTRALAASLPGAYLLEAESGHVGMIAGAAAPELLWEPLRKWLVSHGAGPGAGSAPNRSFRRKHTNRRTRPCPR